MHTKSILDLYKANRHAQRPLVKELPRSRLRVLTFNSNVILTVYVLPILLTTMHTTIYLLRVCARHICSKISTMTLPLIRAKTLDFAFEFRIISGKSHRLLSGVK